MSVFSLIAGAMLGGLLTSQHRPRAPPMRMAAQQRPQSTAPSGGASPIHVSEAAVELAAQVEEWKAEDERLRLEREAAAVLLRSPTPPLGGDNGMEQHLPPPPPQPPQQQQQPQPKQPPRRSSSSNHPPQHASAASASAAAAAAPSARLSRARERMRRALDEEPYAGGGDGYELLPAAPAPSLRYDPTQAAARFASQPMAVMSRQMKLLAPLLAFVSKVVLDVQQGQELARRPQRAEELTALIGSLGPAIIKAGQALSSRSDLLPAEYLAQLSTLQDRVPPFAHSEALDRLEAELGQPLHALFSDFGAEPVAAASLGQVYKATTREGGRSVAVKVLRPHVEGVVALDLYLLRSYSQTLTALTKRLGRNIDLVSVIDDFGHLLYSEIDYGVEASHARRFKALYGSLPNVTSPAILPELSTRSVLTMEWMDGVRLSDADALASKGLNPSDVLHTLVHCSLRQMLDTGLFHADPHLGNLLVSDKGELVYLDFGMMATLSDSQRHAIIEAVVHLVNRDFVKLAHLYKELGFLPSDQDVEPIAKALHEALPLVLSASVGELNIKSVVTSLGDVMYAYPFSLPPFYTSMLRCLGVLEGVALQVDPSVAVIHAAYPYVAARLLTERSPRLQAALASLLLDDATGRLRWESLEALLESAVGSTDYDAIAAAEQLAEYLLSPSGQPLQQVLVEQLVEWLDELGAESAEYLARGVVALAAPVLGEVGVPPPSWAAAAPSARTGRGERAGGSSSGKGSSGKGGGGKGGGGSSSSGGDGSGGSSSSQGSASGRADGDRRGEDGGGARDTLDLLSRLAEQLDLPAPSARIERALRTIELLQRTVRGHGPGGTVDLPRVTALATSVLGDEMVQRRLADLGLQLVQRGLQRGIRAVFALSEDNAAARPAATADGGRGGGDGGGGDGGGGVGGKPSSGGSTVRPKGAAREDSNPGR